MESVLEIENIITVCAWCLTEINTNGIRKKRKFNKDECEGLSNGICLVCAMKNFT